MNVSSTELRSFVMLSHSGSFHQAALALNISQPALTRRIQKLEAILGVALFERSTRNVTLSAVGREFLPKAQRLLSEWDASLLSIAGMAEKASGQVTVACVPTAAQYFMPRALGGFSRKHPRMRVKIIDEPASVVLSSVLAGEADFGLGFGRNLGEDIAFEVLMDDPYVLACRVDHPLAGREAVEWADLDGCPFIQPGSRNGNRFLIDLNLSRGKTGAHWVYEVQHLSTSLALVEEGLGVSVVSTLLKLLNHNPRIAFVPLVNPTLFRGIGILRRAKAALSPGAQSFYEELRAVWLDAAHPAVRAGAGPS